MLSTEQLQQLRELISEGQLDQAFQGMLALPDLAGDNLDQLQTLSAQYYHIEQQRTLNLLETEVYTVRLNNVIFGLLRFCTRLNQTAQAQKPTNLGTIATGNGQAGPTRSLRLQEGISAYESQDFARAVSVLESIIAEQPDQPEALLYLGNMREEIGDYVAAVEFYSRAAAARPDYALAYNNRSVVYLQHEMLEDALRDLNQALELDSKLGPAYLNRALVFMELSEYAVALEDLNQCARLGQSLESVYHLRGLVKINLEDFAGAIQDAERGLRLNAGNYEHHFNLALAHFNNGYYRESVQHFDRTLELNPLYYEATKLRGMAHCLIENYELAGPDIEKIITQEPDLADGHYWLGYIKQYTGDPEGAVYAFNDAIRCDPHHKASYVNRGCIALENELYQEALSDFKTAQQLDPNWDILPPLIQQAEENLGKKKWF